MSEVLGPGSFIAGRYRIESLLGQGGMASVFAAVDTATGRTVALKLLAPTFLHSADAVLRFLAEARATAKIEHPNVVEVIDMGREGQVPFLVMERLRGESLRKRLERGRLDVASALDIVIAACRGIAEAHREGVIHRDVKPDNIFLCRSSDGSVFPKVVDFGIAKLRGGVPLTQSGVTIGTIRYMSPEQLGAPREADPGFDVYGMGTVLYEALAARPAFDARNMLELMRQIVEGDAPPLRSLAPDVPPALEAVVHRAMHTDRAQRYTTMNELVAALDRVRKGAPHSPRSHPPRRAPAGPTPSVPRAPASRRLLLAGSIGGAVALFVVAAVGGGVYVWARPSLPSELVPVGPPAAVVDLRAAGGCDARFDGRIRVRSAYGGVYVESLGPGGEVWGALTVASNGRPALRTRIDVAQARWDEAVVLSITLLDRRMRGSDGALPWTNVSMSPTDLEPIRGTITVAQWEPSRTQLDVQFDGVQLWNHRMGTSCTVDGRLRTFGPFE